MASNHSKWYVTSYQLMPQIRFKVAGFVASKNLTYTKLFNALMIALLNGDIKINTSTRHRMVGDYINPIEEILSVKFTDREGKILNPNRFNIEECKDD